MANELQMSPWSTWELPNGSDDFSSSIVLSTDRTTVTITDSSASARIYLVYTAMCNPGDVLEFSVEAAHVNGEMCCSVQAGTATSVISDAMGGSCRDIRYVDSSFAGFRLYKMRVVVPETAQQPYATWFIGGTLAQVGAAKFRWPKMYVNGRQVGATQASVPVVHKIGDSNNYATFVASNDIDFTHSRQLDGQKGMDGDPVLFNIGSFRQSVKIIGNGQTSATLAVAQFGDEAQGSGVRLFKSAAAGPGLSSSGLSDGTTVGFLDAIYDTGDAHKRAGRINFFCAGASDPAFTITTPDTSDNEDVNGLYIWKNGNFSPKTNGVVDCGTPQHLWNNVRASVGTIQTSDSRAKAAAEDPSEALMRAWGKVGFKVFQFRDAIEQKGEEAARLHVGVIAQEVAEAFASEGLDASRYGLFCYDEWDSWTDEDGTVHPAGNSYGIRYEEALALECAYQRWRLEQMEARLVSQEVQ